MPATRLSLALALLLSTLAAAAAGAQSITLSPAVVPLDAATRGVAAGEAFVDLGTVSARSGDGRGGIVVRRRVAVRLDAGAGGPASARLSVALATETPGCTVRVDGVTLSTLPRVVDPVHRVGTAVVHEIEVTIPASVPAGSFVSDLQWLAESD